MLLRAKLCYFDDMFMGLVFKLLFYNILKSESLFLIK